MLGHGFPDWDREDDPPGTSSKTKSRTLKMSHLGRLGQPRFTILNITIIIKTFLPQNVEYRAVFQCPVWTREAGPPRHPKL